MLVHVRLHTNWYYLFVIITGESSALNSKPSGYSTRGGKTTTNPSKNNNTI